MAFTVKSEDGSTVTLSTTTDAQGRVMVNHASASPASRLVGRAVVGNAPTLIVPAQAGRQSVLIKLVGASPQAVFVGGPDVSASTGFDIPGLANAALELNGEAAVWGIVVSGSQAVSFVEEF